MSLRVYHRVSRKGRHVFLSLMFWSVFSCFALGLLLMIYPDRPRTKNYSDGEIIIDLSNNYFQSQNDFTTSQYLIDDEKCRVPDIDVWDKQVRELFEVPSYPKCNESAQITLIKNNRVVINEAALQKLGYTLDDVSCCYNTIERISQDRATFDRDADNKFRFSDECYEMKMVTKPKSGFIKVSCEVNSLIPLKSKLYEQFHALAVFPEETSATDHHQNQLYNKLLFWKKRFSKGLTTLPPNILVLGIDSTSRFNFQRLMHNTVNVLNNVIEAEELKGYTKVAENTFPNFVPMLTSVTEDELRKICYSSRWIPQDDCPYIWKDFSYNNYLTAHLEDSPRMSIFNYFKTGFVDYPVDFYMRAFMLAAYQFEGGFPWTVDCLGYQRPEDMIWDYIVDLAELAKKEHIPYFITSWLTDVSHDGMFGIQTMDKKLSKTLLQLHNNHLLENTLLLVMSDHGYRFLKIRSTKSGWYEDKMPAMWIKLPSTVRSLHPDWTEALRENSRTLVTPFDINYAFRHILEIFRVVQRKEKNETSFLKETPKLRAISPFRKIPKRTCKEAGIPRGYCPCAAPVAYDNKVFIKLAAQFFINYINAQLPNVCVPLRVSTVTAFGTPDKNVTSSANSGSVEYPETSVISLRVTPGNFLYEAWLRYDRTKGNFTKVFDILRMNGMSGEGSCVSKTDEFIEMEKYCYCQLTDNILSFIKRIL